MTCLTDHRSSDHFTGGLWNGKTVQHSISIEKIVKSYKLTIDHISFHNQNVNQNQSFGVTRWIRKISLGRRLIAVKLLHVPLLIFFFPCTMAAVGQAWFYHGTSMSRVKIGRNQMTKNCKGDQMTSHEKSSRVMMSHRALPPPHILYYVWHAKTTILYHSHSSFITLNGNSNESG